MQCSTWRLFFNRYKLLNSQICANLQTLFGRCDVKLQFITSNWRLYKFSAFQEIWAFWNCNIFDKKKIYIYNWILFSYFVTGVAIAIGLVFLAFGLLTAFFFSPLVNQIIDQVSKQPYYYDLLNSNHCHLELMCTSIQCKYCSGKSL